MRTLWIGFFCAGAIAVGEDHVARALDEKLTSAQRNDACFALRGNDSSTAIEAMQRLLADENLRACAATNLRLAGAVEVLVSALDDETPEVRAAAAFELGAMAKPEFVTPLARAARDPNLIVATSALQALSQYIDRTAVAALLELADTGGAVGLLAVDRLLSARELGLLPLARRMLAGPDIPARLAAMRVLSELGDASDLAPLRVVAVQGVKVSASGRGFGLMPAINLARAARTAVERIEARTKLAAQEAPVAR